MHYSTFIFILFAVKHFQCTNILIIYKVRQLLWKGEVSFGEKWGKLVEVRNILRKSEGNSGKERKGKRKMMKVKRTIDSLFEEKWGRSKKQLGLFEEHLFFLEQMRFFLEIEETFEEKWGKLRKMKKVMMRNTGENYEEKCGKLCGR